MSVLKLNGTRVTGFYVEDGSGEDVGERLELTLDLVCAWNQNVAKSMGWLPEDAPDDFPPARCTKMTLSGSLAGESMMLTPNKDDLKEYGVDIAIDKVSGFKYAAKYDEETELASEREVSFTVSTKAVGALESLAQFVQKLNPGALTSVVKIIYNDADAPEDDPQTELDGVETKRGRKKAAKE